MNTQRWYSKFVFRTKALLVLGAIFSLTGCLTKTCPVPLERQPFITSTPWRLVSTNDTDFGGLNKYSFAVYTFNQDFTGKMQVVQNNTLYEDPVRLLAYDVDSAQKLIRIQYAFPAGKGGSSSSGGSGASGNDVVEYSYKLGRTLVLISEDGTYYNFVPYTGVISPDDTCEYPSSLF